MELVNKALDMAKEVKYYWKQPRPGEYVPYKEVVMLSLGWMALYMSISWTIGFGVGNQFTGMTLKMNNTELLVMGYVCTIIGYLLTPLNAWIIDNFRIQEGKYRKYIKLAIPSMCLTILSLWLPYEQIRDGSYPGARYVMIAVLFVMAELQSYVQGWVTTGVTNMIHVITPNTQERTKIMAITSIIYSGGHTINNVYYPFMVDLLCKNGDKYNMTYFRGAYTPMALIMPLVLLAYFGTQERLVLPKSRISKVGLATSVRAVAGNKIFWIRCADGWNDFLEGAKGNIWDWLVYRAHIMKSTTYGLLNTISYNSMFWGMLLSPWFIKRFGKRNIKIVKNIIQVFLIASYFLFYKSPMAGVGLFVVYTLDRFIDTYNVIDSAIEADMRDNQQYLIGERIDGAFGFVQSYAGGAIGMVTGLFIPWVYKKKGFDGNDYSVLDVYTDYDETLPLSQQKKNPNCVLYSLMDTLLVISIVGAAIDVLPWFAYDISENGQRAMIRVIRLRTVVEDTLAGKRDETTYIEGCEAVLKAREYAGKEKKEVPRRKEITTARREPAADKAERAERVKAVKQRIAQARDFNEELEIAEFVNRELNRFGTEFGRAQLALCEQLVAGGPDRFYENAEAIIAAAHALPHSHVKEEKIWRKQEVRNARALLKSARLAAKHYPDGVVPFDPQTAEDAYDMPDGTREQAKARRRAMKDANKAQNIYNEMAAPYLSAKRTLMLHEGYQKIDEIMADYDDVARARRERLDAEREKEQALADERRFDKERIAAEKRLRR
ncbi:MAG: MFS transporter [Clostridia bacterium]|nr:MFS transporter [Clostridia bacterium]